MGCIRTGSLWRWPNGVIPFTISNDDFPPGSVEEVLIRQAMDLWENATNIRFEERTNEPYYVKFVPGKSSDTCNSYVGKKTVPMSLGQKIYCDPTNNNLAHEIGHAIGLWHEQSREDRNAFISVNIENIQSNKLNNFAIHTDDGAVVGDYDYGSMMHYGRRTFVVQWLPAVPLPDQTSRNAPTIAIVSSSTGSEIHLVHLGENSSSLYHTWTDDGRNWEPDDEPIPGQTSKLVPAIAAWNNELHMVHLGESSNDIWYSRSVDHRTWTADNRISEQKSKATPALASFNGELHMVHLGSSSNDLYHSWTTDGTSWNEQKITGQKSKATPALATFGGQLHLVHLGDSSDDLWHSWSVDGRNWTDDVRIEDKNSPKQWQSKSQATPALCEFNGKLHMAHIGDSSTTIWHSTFDGSVWEEDVRNDNNRSRKGPTLAVFRSALHSVHLGETSNRLWHTVQDTTLLTFTVPSGTTAPGQRTSLTPGDIDAVNTMYP